MKRTILFLLMVMVLSISVTMAQDGRVKYYGEVFFAGNVGFANVMLEGEKVSDRNLPIYGTSLHTIHGAKSGKYFSVGIGVGLDILLINEQNSVELGGMLLPLYADFKFWVPNKSNVTPFLMADLGCSTLFYPFTAAPLYGIGVGFKAGKFIMSLGYMRDGINLSPDGARFFNSEFKFWEHKVQLRVGVSF